MTTVFVDPPSPPGFTAFRHSHGGYGECCRSSRLKFPTLDLFHAATSVPRAAVIDAVLEDLSPRRCVEAVLARKPKTVVIRAASGSLDHDLALASSLRARFDGAIVLYGPAVDAQVLAHPAVDGIALGEPALAFATAKWKRGAKTTLDAGRVDDVNALPIPRWDLVDFRKYSYVTAQTSWGCPFGCGYCPYPVTQGKKWRTRSAASVVAEFRALRRRHGLRFVLLRDPEFSLEKARTLELCRALEDAGTPLMWGCETRLDTLDEELIDAMARAGCVRVAFGVESLEPAVLARMGRKHAAPAAVRAKVAALKRRGMLTYAMYMVGLPGETERSTKRMIDFAVKLGTNAASFSAATPFPGTALSAMAPAAPKRLTSCVASMGNETLSTADVQRLYDLAKRTWKGK